MYLTKYFITLEVEDDLYSVNEYLKYRLDLPTSILEPEEGPVSIFLEDEWFSILADMSEVSAAFKENLMEIRAFGQGAGDISVIFAKNGNVDLKNATINWPEYDGILD